MLCGWLDTGRQEDTVHINAHWLHLLWEVVKPKCWPDLKCELEREVWRNFPVVILTLFSPPYFCVSKEGGGDSNICPPLVFRVWFGSGFQIFLDITCLGMIYQIQKVSWSLDNQNPPRKSVTRFLAKVWTPNNRGTRLPPLQTEFAQ